MHHAITTQIADQHSAALNRLAHETRVARQVAKPSPRRNPRSIRRAGVPPKLLRRALPVICAAACLTVIAVLASARAASAATPARSTVVLDETFVYPIGDPNPCPFEVTFRNQGTFFVTTFVDANGDTIRELDRGAYFLESYSANGNVIASKSPAMTHVDPATNTVIGTGSQRHFTVPGLGLVYAQAGRFVIDVTTGETLSVSGLDVPLSDKLCAALTA
jgi:hypothetical protein